jgi:hypothetical protein
MARPDKRDLNSVATLRKAARRASKLTIHGQE